MLSVTPCATPIENLPELYKSLLLYQTGGSVNYATLHDVSQDKQGKHSLSAGVHLSLEEVKQLLCLLSDSDDDRHIIPANVLSKSQSHLLWFVKGTIKFMWFRTSSGNKHYQVPYPNTLYLSYNNQLFITSYKGRQSPKHNSRLYHSPLWNTYASSQVCTGSVDLPTGYHYDTRQAWQQVITQTFFSHTNHEHSLKGKKNTLTFWRNLQKEKSFPAHYLNPIPFKGKQLTVQSWMEQVIK